MRGISHTAGPLLRDRAETQELQEEPHADQQPESIRVLFLVLKTSRCTKPSSETADRSRRFMRGVRERGGADWRALRKPSALG